MSSRVPRLFEHLLPGSTRQSKSAVISEISTETLVLSVTVNLSVLDVEVVTSLVNGRILAIGDGRESAAYVRVSV